MRELPQVLPDANVLIALEPEELGTKLLFLARKRYGPDASFDPTALIDELEPPAAYTQTAGYPSPYPGKDWDLIRRALAEAWWWREAQGLLVPSPDVNGRIGSRILTRRARKMETQRDVADYRVTRLLPKENLHSKIADVVWGAFVRGEFDSAAFQAMKAVEVSVRDASELGHGKIGTDLMQEASLHVAAYVEELARRAGEAFGQAAPD
ncbi:MAG: TIGR02391 family protein [Bryobacteraceae bacterium]